jgi:rfaE bifunctional protein kinase chain/domain
MNEKELRNIFRSFEDKKVLIIGDVMVDAYVWGNVTRVSPEAPVPIVSVQKKENRLGGAANVALNIKAMGATPMICSVTGEDMDGKTFFELLEEEGLSSKGMFRSRKRITTVKTRVIGNHHHLLRVDEETECALTEDETTHLSRRVSEAIDSGADVIIFEDYDKGSITPALIEHTMKEAKKKKVPVVVDPKKKNFLSYREATLFKPNLKELKEGLKLDFDHHNMRELQKAVETLRKSLDAQMALVTLSEMGIYISSKNYSQLIPAHTRDIADVSGAGDTVAGIAALCVSAGLSPEHIGRLSNLAGGLVCEKVGVVPADKTQLLEEALGLVNKKQF